MAGIPLKVQSVQTWGYINGEYVLNPTYKELATSDLDLVVAGTDKAVLMVESEVKRIKRRSNVGCSAFGHEEMQTAIAIYQSICCRSEFERISMASTCGEC